MPTEPFNPVEKMANCINQLRLINTDYYTIMFRVITYLGYYAAYKTGIIAFNRSVYLKCYEGIVSEDTITNIFMYRNEFCHAGSIEVLNDKINLILYELPEFEDMDFVYKRAVFWLRHHSIGDVDSMQ